MEIEELVAKAKRLCYQVAPTELDGYPLYILPQTELPPLLGQQTVCYGYTSPSLDMHLHHTFKNWDGQRGPVIVLGNLNIARDFPQRFPNKILGTTLHELAHVLERPSPCQPRAYHQQMIRIEALKIASVVSINDETDEPSSTPPWTNHEARFMRIAFHLYHRARRLGYDIRPREVYHSELVGLSAAQQYAATLAEEANTLSNATFRQICDMPLPPLFSRMYQQDKTRWMTTHYPSDLQS